MEMELSHQGSVEQNSLQNESQLQVFQQQNLYDQQQRAGEVNAGPCTSKLRFVMELILMRLEQGQSISRTALPRPWNPSVANRLLTAVSPNFRSLKNLAYLTLHRDNDNGR